MPIVISHEEVKHTRTSRMREDGKSTARTDFIVPPADNLTSPQAFLSEQSSFRHLRTHFHHNDQFQIFVEGGGTNASHVIQPFQVHFTRKHTPYGPINANELGCKFLTLRRQKDPGAQYLPESREKLESFELRNPWQVTGKVAFPEVGSGVKRRPVDGVHDENGLDAQAITMEPNAKGFGPDASTSSGQYIAVLGGSLIYEEKEYGAISLVWLDAAEGAFPLQAGAKGLNAVALNFPQKQATPASSTDKPQGELKVWQCVLCAFVYDEVAGMPEEGIPPGTRWEDVPDTFGCPDCSASKADFEMIEI